MVCILDDDSMPYGVPKELAKEIKKLPALPDCFVADTKVSGTRT